MTAASRYLEISVVPHAPGGNFGAVYMHPSVLKPLPEAKWEAVCLENWALRQFKVLVSVGSLQLHHIERRRGSFVLIYFICFIM